MKIIYIDPYSGISGDMTLGAMVDLGMPFDYLEGELKKLNLNIFRLTNDDVLRGGIRGKLVTVNLLKENKKNNSNHGRHLSEIEEIISKSGLDEKIKNRSIQMFRKLAEVEGKVHDQPPEEIHFHEVGAVDSIVDIIGAAIAFDYFSPVKVYCGKINLGGGTAQTDHGLLPVPPPAVAGLIQGMPVYSDGTEMELTTPTGALILKTFVDEFRDLPPITIHKVAYGAGTRDIKNRASLLRLFLGEADEIDVQVDSSIVVIECETDDVNPERLGYLMDKLIELSVLDVFYTPIQMKKNRPGTLISILVKPEQITNTATLLFNEGITLGIRFHRWERMELERKISNVQTEFGNIRFKTGYLDGKIVSIKPEYDDCKEAAIKYKKTLNEIHAVALKKYREQEKE